MWYLLHLPNAKQSNQKKRDTPPLGFFDIYLAEQKQKAEAEASRAQGRKPPAAGGKPGRPKSINPRVMVGAGLKTTE